MRECKIVLPHNDNEGRSLAWVHHQLAKDLCEAFGGFTSTSGDGGWKLGDKLQYEECTIYWFAVEPQHQLRVKPIAVYAARCARQKALYFVGYDGEAHCEFLYYDE